MVGTGWVGCCPVGSGRVGSGRVGSGRVGSGRVGSGRVWSGLIRVRVTLIISLSDDKSYGPGCTAKSFSKPEQDCDGKS